VKQAAWLLLFIVCAAGAQDHRGAVVDTLRKGGRPDGAHDVTIDSLGAASGSSAAFDSSAARDSSTPGGDTMPVPDKLRHLANIAYSGGEYLKFDVHWSFVTAGDAYLTVSDTVYAGRPCHIITFRLESRSFFDLFYKVRDRYRTIVDAQGLFPWRFEQQIREGGYSRDFTAEFNQQENVAVTDAGRYPIPPYVQDIMSAFYFARTVDYTGFRPGQKIELQNFYKDSTYQLAVKYKGRQRIEVDAGTFDCIIIQPLVSEGGLFKGDGKIYLWITDDDRKLPVKVRTDIPIGTVESDLTEYRGVNGPLHALIHDD
jgi:hypothetical protein